MEFYYGFYIGSRLGVKHFASYLALSQTGATGAAKGHTKRRKTGKLEDQLFSLLDKNSDGSVNRSDFEALFAKAC